MGGTHFLRYLVNSLNFIGKHKEKGKKKKKGNNTSVYTVIISFETTNHPSDVPT
jgi:hypothetical protein